MVTARDRMNSGTDSAQPHPRSQATKVPGRPRGTQGPVGSWETQSRQPKNVDPVTVSQFPWNTESTLSDRSSSLLVSLSSGSAAPKGHRGLEGPSVTPPVHPWPSQHQGRVSESRRVSERDTIAPPATRGPDYRVNSSPPPWTRQGHRQGSRSPPWKSLRDPGNRVTGFGRTGTTEVSCDP